MRVVQVTEKNGPLRLAERAWPEPGPGEVRVKVEARGVCHSDSLAVDGTITRSRLPPRPRARVGWFGGAATAANLAAAVT